jgi:hypothetical protein
VPFSSAHSFVSTAVHHCAVGLLQLPSSVLVQPLGECCGATVGAIAQSFELELSAVFARAELRVLLLLRTLGFHEWLKATLNGSKPMLVRAIVRYTVPAAKGLLHSATKDPEPNPALALTVGTRHWSRRGCLNPLKT